MRIAFLTNNDNTQPLIDWLRNQGEEVTVYEDHEDMAPADLIISYNYRKYVGKKYFNKTPAINCHISFLPYNRGAHPVLWAALDNTPFGVTIHWMTEQLDRGPILEQREVWSHRLDTLRELYDRHQEVMQRLFVESWEYIKTKVGTEHSTDDLDTVRLPNGWDTTIEGVRQANDRMAEGDKRHARQAV
jgi:methionyl-tRNA formyltransferase